MHSFDGITKPKLVHNVVLYQKGTGEVRHIHTEVFYDGALELDKDTMERKAFELAKKKSARRVILSKPCTFKTIISRGVQNISSM